ncbi:hypothetical protein D6827_01620, partial [Candidatus Parcubacteria bacterium]
LSSFEITTIIFSFFWLSVFIIKPQLRKEMFATGILSLFILPLSFSVQYNVPKDTLFSAINLIELWFTFTFTSLSAVIFHLFFGKHYHRPWREKLKKQHTNGLWLLKIFTLVTIFIWLTILFNAFLDIPGVFAILISAIVITAYIISHRHDLLADAIFSSLIMGFIVFSVTIFASLFSAPPIKISFVNTAGYFAGIPIELIIWSLALGLLMGPIYEYSRRLKLK